MITIHVQQQTIQKDHPIRLEDLAKELQVHTVAATVNNRLRELSYVIYQDATVEFLTTTNYDYGRIYATSMRYLVVMAAKRLYPEALIKFSNSISMGIYGRFVEGVITAEMVHAIKHEMKRLIEANLPITRKQMPIAKVKQIYKQEGYLDKVETLKYRKEIVNIYECDGYLNYMYGYMVPSTGYLKEFEILSYYPGFLIRYPRLEAKGQIPEFSDSPAFLRVLNRAEQWAIRCRAEMIYQMNQIVEQKQEVAFVNMCETRHNQQLCELGNILESDITNLRLIAIAGPSSSGKTTFSKRLEIELLTRGIKPLMISIDNYYFSKDYVPKDEYNQPDFEHIEALDLSLFHQNIGDLIAGNPVALPRYSFKDQKREFLPPISIDKKTPIIIEGIHALNDRLSYFIPANQIFKIYISPFAQINIDYNNPINLTDLRLLRRIVRDLQFRGTSPAKTLEMWPSVRRGEYKWIYPFVERANYIYNSELTYELMVMKRYALDALLQIQNDSEHYIQANRLIKFLKLFKEINPYTVPCNSILREFIGKSVFEH